MLVLSKVLDLRFTCRMIQNSIDFKFAAFVFIVVQLLTQVIKSFDKRINFAADLLEFFIALTFAKLNNLRWPSSLPTNVSIVALVSQNAQTLLFMKVLLTGNMPTGTSLTGEVVLPNGKAVNADEAQELSLMRFTYRF